MTTQGYILQKVGEVTHMVIMVIGCHATRL